MENQDEIFFLKANQPPLKIVNAVKFLSVGLCKIAGAHAADGTLHGSYFCIVDGCESNIVAFNNWLKSEFGLDCKVHKISEREFFSRFSSKIFARYLTRIFCFPDGCKTYSVEEPQAIRNSRFCFRKAFVLGALTFEAGIGIRQQVEFCVSSEKFIESICNVLNLLNVKYTKMNRKSCGYWRFWSNKLSKEEIEKWLELFEPETEKWFKLYDYLHGFQGKVESFDEAVGIFDRVYGVKSSSKVSLKEVMCSIRVLGRAHRYKLADYLAKKLNVGRFGGKWAHSLSYYLNILKSANFIHVELQEFGKKRSFGTIFREVYVYNPNSTEWRVPIRSP